MRTDIFDTLHMNPLKQRIFGRIDAEFSLKVREFLLASLRGDEASRSWEASIPTKIVLCVTSPLQETGKRDLERSIGSRYSGSHWTYEIGCGETFVITGFDTHYADGCVDHVDLNRETQLFVKTSTSDFRMTLEVSL